MHHVSRNELSAPQGVQLPFARRSRLSIFLSLPLSPPPPLTPFVHHTKRRLHHHLRALTAVPRTPPFTSPFCFLRREISTHSTRTGRQVYISSIPGGPRSCATPLRRRRALMLSYMICLTSPREIPRLLVPGVLLLFHGVHAREIRIAELYTSRY